MDPFLLQHERRRARRSDDLLPVTAPAGSPAFVASAAGRSLTARPRGPTLPGMSRRPLIGVGAVVAAFTVIIAVLTLGAGGPRPASSPGASTGAVGPTGPVGSDGQPGSYTDVDHCDAIALWGHNCAETQTVLWMRMMDRRCGPDPPALLAVDPRPTPVAREADVHLAVRAGTNLALMNAILRQLLHKGWIDEAYEFFGLFRAEWTEFYFHEPLLAGQ